MKHDSPDATALIEAGNVCVHPQAAAYADVHGITLPAGLPLRTSPQPRDEFQLVEQQGLALQSLRLGKVKPLQVDFVSGQLAHRRHFGGGRKQDIARACGLHQQSNLYILDATAGLGRDSFVLASLGARVRLIERHPILWALLQDGLLRAERAGDDDLSVIIARMTLIYGDAQRVPGTELGEPHVVYLDPMFPARDKSAKVKADMQTLHTLLAPEAGVAGSPDGSLLDWASGVAGKRVVVKRPRLAEPLDQRPPDHQLVGKANRFDVYTLKRLVS